MRRFCPRHQGRPVQPPMITAPVAPPGVRPPRGGGKVGRGRPRGGGQPGGGQLVGSPARFYVFPAKPDAEASNAVITGSTYSYVSSLFSHFLGVPRESLGILIYMSTLVGNVVIVDRIYRSCNVTFYGYETRADSLLLDMTNFEIILGMDWLSLYHVVLDCHAKIVTLEMPELPRFEWKGSSVSASNQVISFLKA
ncbi:uncharacterized protein [Nicotiana tomentosiformis]|uniref:uncharacterized protein n=1 Tax=Nicotiana tomentosiformis TaxID=4098 RepID=UPI00388CCCF3